MVKATSLACIAVLCGMVLFVVVGVFSSSRILNTLALQTGSLQLAQFVTTLYGAQPSSLSSISDNEARVFSDHGLVTQRMLACIKAPDVSKLPFALRSLIIPFSSGISVIGPEPADKSGYGRDPVPEEQAILLLSQTLVRQRLSAEAAVTSTFGFWQLSSLLAIFLGMITTILIGISSTDFGRGDGRRQTAIRLLAIIFPALGTASAAVVAFYAPQAAYTQASHTLAVLTQLHGQMGFQLWRIECVKDEEDKEGKATLAKALDGWSKSYLDLQTVNSAVNQTTNGPASTPPAANPGASPTTPAQPVKPSTPPPPNKT